MGKRKKVIVKILMLAGFLLGAVWCGSWIIREYTTCEPVMTEKEIQVYRETHPQFCSYPSLIEMNISPMEFYSSFYDYVLFRYENGVFLYEDTVVKADRVDISMEDYIDEKGRLKLDWGSLMQEWVGNMIQGQRYLFFVTPRKKGDVLSPSSFYIFYVTDEDAVISASYGGLEDLEVSEGFDGYCLEDFRNVVIRKRRNMPETARKYIKIVEERLIKEGSK